MHDLDRTQFEERGFDSYGPIRRPGPPARGGPMSEWQEAEMASELLEASNEQELEGFLSNLISGAARAAGTFLRSDTGRALGGLLKDTARQALPMVGRAIGERIAPGGGAIGAGIAQRAGTMLGLELEGLSEQDQLFEVARQFVRFANAAVEEAASLPPGPSPVESARTALMTAARDHAPGLAARGAIAMSSRPCPSTGRWVRRGNSIVLLDI